jgi:hypothetical protein
MREEVLFLVLVVLAAVLVLSLWHRRPVMRIALSAIVLFAVALLLVYGQYRRAKIRQTIERVRQQQQVSHAALRIPSP